ncbi:hypothetical protein Lal_00039920 [Lupinus albus]|nr:hypothetical protein Lal_00039920 [Lupinus albus]
MYQHPIFGRQEGSIGTLTYFYFKILENIVELNDKKILEHNFGRDDGSGSSFWSRYWEMES